MERVMMRMARCSDSVVSCERRRGSVVMNRDRALKDMRHRCALVTNFGAHYRCFGESSVEIQSRSVQYLHYQLVEIRRGCLLLPRHLITDHRMIRIIHHQSPSLPHACSPIITLIMFI